MFGDRVRYTLLRLTVVAIIFAIVLKHFQPQLSLALAALYLFWCYLETAAIVLLLPVALMVRQYVGLLSPSPSFWLSISRCRQRATMPPHKVLPKVRLCGSSATTGWVTIPIDPISFAGWTNSPLTLSPFRNTHPRNPGLPPDSRRSFPIRPNLHPTS